eukprot:3038741-Rhodomonas_salina.1
MSTAKLCLAAFCHRIRERAQVCLKHLNDFGDHSLASLAHLKQIRVTCLQNKRAFEAEQKPDASVLPCSRRRPLGERLWGSAAAEAHHPPFCFQEAAAPRSCKRIKGITSLPHSTAEPCDRSNAVQTQPRKLLCQTSHCAARVRIRHLRLLRDGLTHAMSPRFAKGSPPFALLTVLLSRRNAPRGELLPTFRTGQGDPLLNLCERPLVLEIYRSQYSTAVHLSAARTKCTSVLICTETKSQLYLFTTCNSTSSNTNSSGQTSKVLPYPPGSQEQWP